MTTKNLTEQIKSFHPLHSALLGGAVFAATNNAMLGAGTAIASYAYMANFGHSLGSSGPANTAPNTRPATAQPTATPVFHRLEFKNPYQASDYSQHIKYEPGMGSVM